MKRLLLLLAIAASAWAQISSFPPASSVGAPPVGGLGACELYASATAFGGDATRCFFAPIGLATPTTPTLTAHGGTGTDWGYKVYASNPVGYSIESAEATVSGPATLNNSGANVVVHTFAQTGAGVCAVFRSTANGTPSSTGYIGEVSCGSDVTDIGADAGFSLISPADDSSQGLFVSRRLMIPNSGDNAWPDVYVGNPLKDFSPNVASIFLENDQMHFAYFGTTQNRFGLLQMVTETTDGPMPPLQVAALTQASGSDNVGIISFAGSTGNGNTLGSAEAYEGQGIKNVFGTGTPGTITFGSNFRSSLGVTGGHVTDFAGFKADDVTGGTSGNFGFYSGLSSGSGKWAFYGAGTAASHFGGAVEFSALTAGAATGKRVLCIDDATKIIYESSTGTDCSN